MIKAIIFDFDGTLVDFIGTDIAAMKVVHQACGAKCSVDEFVETAIREIMTFHALVEEGRENPLDLHPFRLKNTLSQFGVAWDSEYLSVYQNALFDHSVPYEGVENLLTMIRKREVKIGLITNAYNGDEQRERIRRAGLYPFFDSIIIAGEVGYAKPSAEIFHLALERLRLKTDQVIYVGDSIKHDIQGAKNAGTRSIFVSYLNHYESDLANYSCKSVNELSFLIEKLIS